MNDLLNLFIYIDEYLIKSLSSVYLNGYIMEIIENTGVNTVAVEHSGLQTLSGVQATAYARIRYTSGDDFKRAERQRLVLAKINCNIMLYI